MATFPLLHVFDRVAVPTKPGLFPIADGVTIPAGWQPLPKEYEPEALPTPFARAEATRLVLAQLDEAEENPLLKQFEWLLLGIATGALELDPQDLRSDAFDNFGHALLRVDEQARYFCRILARVPGGGHLSFGATYRTCLVWSHARRQPSDWDQLMRAVVPLQTEALQVLCDWRESLRAAGRWDRELVAWQRGVDHLVGDTQPTPGLAALHNDTQLVGPVNVELPTGQPTEPTRVELLYLPRHSPGFAGAFQALCRVPPTLAKDSVEFRIGGPTVLGRIRVPAVGADADPLALGLGLLDIEPDAAPMSMPEGSKRWVDGPGGLQQLLESTKLALAQHGRPTSPEGYVVANLALYPDPVRLLAKTRARAAGGERYTSRAESLLLSRGHALPDTASAEAAGGVTATLEVAGQTVRLVLLDRIGGIEVLDLRAAGAVLWAVFIGDAEIVATQGGNIVLADDAPKAMMVHTSESPFEPAEWVYANIAGAGGALSKRLGTLQRFVASYAIENGRTALIDFALDRASRSFARWASGLPDVAPMGRVGAIAATYVSPNGIEARLLRDSLHTA
jgi:hypothetical protein